ncbi:MAG: hypothetical protein JRI77_07985 [Deltaproteobacteria bacterium]|nr:hypothetical protein [Deltaproteobacteria bacterium]
MKMFNTFALVSSLTFFASMVHAGELTYECVIKHVYVLNDSGRLETSAFENQFKGGSFSVSRETGKILGETLTTAVAKGTRVVNHGDKENSFRAVADFGERLQLIEIQEFKQGKAKPFVASSMGGAGIVTGLCK